MKLVYGGDSVAITFQNGKMVRNPPSYYGFDLDRLGLDPEMIPLEDGIDIDQDKAEAKVSPKALKDFGKFLESVWFERRRYEMDGEPYGGDTAMGALFDTIRGIDKEIDSCT